jgi:hypothetical protein
LGEWTDAIIILAVVIGSTMLGFVQEYRASNAVEKLRSQVTIKSTVLRNGKPQIVPSEQVVPGEVVLLSAGSLIPADGTVLETNEFFVNQAIGLARTDVMGFPVRVTKPKQETHHHERVYHYQRKCQSIFLGSYEPGCHWCQDA